MDAIEPHPRPARLPIFAAEMTLTRPKVLGRVSGWSDRSGGADRRDVELELDLLGDEDAAGLERGVPGQAPVLAVDGGATLEADAQVAERVLGGTGLLEDDRDGLGDVLDGQVAGDRPSRSPSRSTEVEEKRDLREVLGVEEVAGLEVAVAVRDAGLDAGDVDGQLDLGVGRVGGVDGARCPRSR